MADVPIINDLIRASKPVDWSYDSWPSGEPYDWGHAARGGSRWDNFDFHLDLGCGANCKKGRIGIDRFAAPGVDLAFDFDRMVFPDGFLTREGLLPIPSNSIQSIISHHALEHIGEGFIRLMDELYRIMEPDGLLRIIVPLFPSNSAVADPDHCRYFMENTWHSFCGEPSTPFWTESFSVPYTKARFQLVDQDITPPPEDGDLWAVTCAREQRVALVANK